MALSLVSDLNGLISAIKSSGSTCNNLHDGRIKVQVLMVTLKSLSIGKSIRFLPVYIKIQVNFSWPKSNPKKAHD